MPWLRRFGELRAQRAQAIAHHAGLRGSGRVGRKTVISLSAWPPGRGMCSFSTAGVPPAASALLRTAAGTVRGAPGLVIGQS